MNTEQLKTAEQIANQYKTMNWDHEYAENEQAVIDLTTEFKNRSELLLSVNVSNPFHP